MLLRTKSFGHAALQFGLAELLPQAFDQYITKKDYAQISFKTIGHNLNLGSWRFDNDPLQTNQFGHPYHGSLFFNSFRANGYNFWQSAAATFAGSYVWETYAENQAPAPNDFINTSFGGTVLGEMEYRLSNRIINNESMGVKRQINEVLGFLIDPQNGLSRILNGKWGEVSANTILRDSAKIVADFNLGTRSIESNNKYHSGWYGHVKIYYGDPTEDYQTPFSNILINTEIGKDDSSKVNVVSVYGSLAGWEIESTRSVEHLAVLSANYDYIRNTAFFYSGQSVRINLLSEFDLSKKLTINTTLGMGPVILGAAPDKYITPNGRDYDYTMGWGINGSAAFNMSSKLYLDLNYRGGWLATINGNPSHYFLHTVSGELSYVLIKGLSLCAERGYYSLSGIYRNHPDIFRNYPYFKGSFKYSVNF
ncbi:DUF3943 domain-containing protein [Mucilaginibacter sabulilitoris]|uniref:DUF3943 domain-containing protein n=1 Tax=Mucilaginibacter sabulilitoris TaxID=1173583 RepID=A0ABZ0TRJ7_9SPHI|nr:DUF3943 domain-containing protein [Mucilaginibacter sabulilitoris]WPU95532.1 DUF3943 domain-containing protein [Mucilaginibacter sabulilitoris]